MSDNAPDRRVQRSTRALWQALFSLLQNQDWDSISVQAICDRADVGRSTFYSHFQTKQALLEAGFSLELTGIRTQILSRSPHLPDTALATVDWLVDHLQQTRALLRRVRGSAAGLLILERFRQSLRNILADELAARGHSLSALELSFLSGGLFVALDEGLAHGDPPDGLSAALSALVLHQCA